MQGLLATPLVSVVLFVVGVLLAIWATERLLEGLVGLARAVSLSTFAIGAILSGFEAENVAVGLAASPARRSGGSAAVLRRTRRRSSGRSRSERRSAGSASRRTSRST